MLNPSKDFLISLKNKLIKEARHNPSDLELDFAELFTLLGHDDEQKK